MTRLLSALLVLVACAGFAQAADAPTLTEVERLKVTNALLATELARLRSEQARRQYEQAVDEARALVRTLQRDGFTLDLQSLTYRPIDAERK